MIYILEGPDGTGKSTLAKQLSEKLDFKIIKMDYPKTQAEKDGMFEQYRTLFHHANNVIIDRAFYSEMVYGPVLRDKSYISEEQQRLLENQLLIHGAQIIYCFDTAENIRQRLKERGEDYLPDEHLETIIERFENLMSTVHHIPVLRYRIGD